MRAMILALIVLAACDPTARNKRIASAITFAASTAALACDAGQTISVAQAGWPGAAHEGNWILGPAPSVGRLAVYNTGMAGANAGAWITIPAKYDWILPLAVTLLETTLVARNMTLAPKPFCGIR